MFITVLRKTVDPSTGKRVSEFESLDLNNLKPEGKTPEEQLEWFENTYVLVPAHIDSEGQVHAMRVGQVFKKGPRKGEHGIFKKNQKPVPDYLKKLGVQDEGADLGTFQMNWHYKIVPDKPDEKGRIYLDNAGSERNSASGKKGALGQRILAYSNWVPIWIFHDTRYYKALRKKFRPNYENLSGVQRQVEMNSAFLENESKSSLTDTASPKSLPSLQEMIKAAENSAVVKQVVKGSDVEQGLNRPDRSLAN